MREPHSVRGRRERGEKKVINKLKTDKKKKVQPKGDPVENIPLANRAFYFFLTTKGIYESKFRRVVNKKKHYFSLQKKIRKSTKYT
jgi:hypothetical protein